MKWLARGSILALFFIFLALIALFDVKSKLSVSMHSLLPQSSAKQALNIYEKINHTHEVIVALKSDSNKSIDESILKKEFPNLSYIYPPKESLMEFEDLYRFYLQDPPKRLLDEDEIRKRLEDLKEEMSEGFLTFIDKEDPLLLFKLDRERLSYDLRGYDNTLIFTLKLNPLEFDDAYDRLHEIIGDDVFIFSPFFYHVENSRIFKKQAKIILSLSALILSFLYLYLLRHPALFIFTAITLLSSTALSQIVAFFVWDEISVYTLIFSGAISTVSIDYMFHHYLHGAYGRNKRFLRPVFYGFITTFIAFTALFFINFTLISQIALTSAVALLFSYCCFAFIYPYLGFGDVKTKDVNLPHKNLISPKIVVILSLVIICLSPLWLKFSADLKALDVTNTKLNEAQNLVQSSFGMDRDIVMLYANSLDELIDRSKGEGAYFPISKLISKSEYEKREDELRKLDFKALKSNLDRISLNLGFKNGYFNHSYQEEKLFPKAPQFTSEFLDDNNLKAGFYDGKFYAVGYKDKITEYENTLVIDSKKLFESEISGVAKELSIIGFFMAVFIFLIVFYLAKKDILRALSFVIAPFAGCLLIFIFSEITILHIFMLVVIIAMSVDYGIYNACVAGGRTDEAISYSLLSTIAGFGVLAISNISSLQAIGAVALCGTVITALLLYLTKVKN